MFHSWYFSESFLLRNEIDVKKKAEQFFDYYNFNRFPTTLYGYAPMEVLIGSVPDKHRFKKAIDTARKNRYLINQKMNYCSVCN